MIGFIMTRVLESGARSSESIRSALSMSRAGVARVLKWSGLLRARLLGNQLESDATLRAPKQHGSGSVCLYSDAEFQIMLAELHYPRFGQSHAARGAFPGKYLRG